MRGNKAEIINERYLLLNRKTGYAIKYNVYEQLWNGDVIGFFIKKKFFFKAKIAV